MEKVSITARWTLIQPWRGLFGLSVTLGYAFLVTSSFDIKEFNGLCTLLIMSFVPILIMVAMGWEHASYPQTGGLSQPWRGMLLTAFVALIGTVACYTILNFLSAGVAQPFTNLYSIVCVMTIFFLIIAFGMWPFGKLSLAARGWLTLIVAYVVTWFLLKLFNFTLLSFPQGVNPSPIGAVPFYAKGGPFEQFATMAPSGPFTWEAATCFYFWMLLFLFVFVVLEMWPFHKFQSLMKQPVMGIVLVIACGALSSIAYGIGVSAMQIEPLRFMLYGICFLFGLLMLMTMFQMWPGRALPPPAGAFLNILIAIGIAIVAYFGYKAFGIWHFGEKAMHYPQDIFAMGNMLLGLTFPAWACYADLWEFWPLPPTPQPPDGRSCGEE